MLLNFFFDPECGLVIASSFWLITSQLVTKQLKFTEKILVHTRTMRGLLFAATSLLTAQGVSAASVTQCGDNLCFTYDDSTLFGTGNVVGDAIFFLPTNFLAQSLDGAGSVSVSDVLNITVNVFTETGFEIDSIFLQEKGDYYLSGSNSTVEADGRISVSSLTTIYDDEELFSAGTLDVQNTLTNWEAGTSIDLADTPGWGSDTEVIVQLQNNLRAVTTEDISEATIFKKRGLIGLSVGEPPAIIPVPAAIWLFGSGLLGLVGVARRRK